MDTTSQFSEVPTLTDCDIELWTDLLGDYISVWLRNTPQFIQEQKQKMLQMALCPFLFGVTYNVPLAWLDILHGCGVIEKDRAPQTTRLSETELEISEMAETIFNRCSQLVENKNDLKTILNFIYDVEERPSLQERIDINYALQAVVGLEVFTSMWAPIKRIYEDRKRQAHVCIIYYFKIISQNVILYGRDGADKWEYLKKILSQRNEAEWNIPSSVLERNQTYIDTDFMLTVDQSSSYIQNEPLSSLPYSNRAKVFLSERDYRGALCDSKRAILLDPKNFNHYLIAAACYLQLNQLDKAEETYNQSLEFCTDPQQREAILQQIQEIRAKIRMTKAGPNEVSSGSEEREIDNVQGQYSRLVYEGSNCYLSKAYNQAMEQFKSAITLLARSENEGPSIEENELLVIWFVYGMSCIRTANIRNIQAGIEKFNAIISSSDKFPAAYYGLGLANMALKSYKEAEGWLRAGLKQIDQSKGPRVYHWPHSAKEIEETDVVTVKKLMTKMVQECLHPPKPDAVCKFHTDSSKREIYVSDLDYRGHICIKCRAGCCIEFHPQCWIVTDNLPKGKPNWKDMLDTDCPTPGCWGLISDVFICRPDQEKSLKLSSQTDPKPRAQPHKPKLKMKTESSSMLEKKMEKKRIRKEKMRETQGLNQEAKEGEKDPQDIGYLLQPDEEEAARNIDRSGTVLIKDDPEVLVEHKRLKASKAKKKEKKQKQFLTVDVHFKGDEDKQRFGVNSLDDDGDFVNRPSTIVNSELLPAPGSGLATDTPQSAEESSLHRLDMALFDFFFRILVSVGPLDLFGSELEDKAKFLSEKAQSRIHDSGGLVSFLSADPRFKISQDNIISSAVAHRTAHGNPWEKLKPEESIRFSNIGRLNPGAKEFIPHDSPSNSEDAPDSDQPVLENPNPTITEPEGNELPPPGNDDGFTTVVKKKRVPTPNLNTQSDIYFPLRPASSYSSFDEISINPKSASTEITNNFDRDESKNIETLMPHRGVEVSGAAWNDRVEARPARDSPGVPHSVQQSLNSASHGSDASDVSAEDVHRVSSPALSTNSGSSSGRADSSRTSSQMSGQPPSLRPLKVPSIVLPSRGKKKKALGHSSSRLHHRPTSAEGNLISDGYEEESVSSTTSDRDSSCGDPRVPIPEKSPLATADPDTSSSASAIKDNINTTNFSGLLSRQDHSTFMYGHHQNKTFEAESSLNTYSADLPERVEYHDEYMPSNDGLGTNFQVTRDDTLSTNFVDNIHLSFQKERPGISDDAQGNVLGLKSFASAAGSIQQYKSRILDQASAKAEKKVTFGTNAPDTSWTTYNYFDSPLSYKTGNDVRDESEVPSGDPWLKKENDVFSPSSDELFYRKGLVVQSPSSPAAAPERRGSDDNAHFPSTQNHHDLFNPVLSTNFSESGKARHSDPWSRADNLGSQPSLLSGVRRESSLLSSFDAWNPPTSAENLLYTASAYPLENQAGVRSNLTLPKYTQSTTSEASVSSRHVSVKPVSWAVSDVDEDALHATTRKYETAEAQTTLSGYEVREMQVKMKMLKEAQATKELALLEKSQVQEAFKNCEKQLTREKAVTEKLKQDIKKMVTRVQMAEKLKVDFEQLAAENHQLQLQNQVLASDVQDLNNQLDAERLKSFNAQAETLELKCQISKGRLDASKQEASQHLHRLASVIAQSEAGARTLPDSVYKKHKELSAYIMSCDGLWKQIEVNAQRLKQDLIKGVAVDLSMVEVAVPALPQPPSELTGGSQAKVENKAPAPSARGGVSLRKAPKPAVQQEGDSEDEDLKAYLSMFCADSRDPAVSSRKDGAAVDRRDTPVKPIRQATSGAHLPGTSTLPGKRTHAAQPETAWATAASNSKPQTQTPRPLSSHPFPMNMQQTEQKSYFERILETVDEHLPGYSRDKIQQTVDRLRRSNGGTLSGWTFEELANRVLITILDSEQEENHEDINAPVQHFSNSWSKLDANDLQCSICQCEIDPQETLSLACGHKFHDSCFHEWFKTDRTCPNCRSHTLLLNEYPTLK